MTIKIALADGVNESKLMDELLALNLINSLNQDMTSTIRDGFVFVEKEENVTLVQQIIEAHDPTPLPPQLTLEEKIIEQEKVINDLVALLADKGVIL